MIRRTLIFLALALAPFTAHAQLASFSQDFEGMDPFDAAALADDGWLVYGIVYDGAGNFIYNYGPTPFPAPNSTADNKTNGFRFSLLTTGEGDPNGDQGNVQLVTLSDYENTDHGDPDRQIESIFFQEQTIGAGDVGTTWVFEFDANNRDLVPPTTARAFIKTIDLGTGFATNFFTLDMSSLTAWGTHSISIDIIPELEGQLVQFGFDSLASDYNSSGILYDNISFAPESTGPVVITSNSLNVNIGSLNSGGVPELEFSDNQYAVLDPVFLTFRYQLQFTVDATSSTDTPSALEFSYESRTANFVGTVEQELELFNYDSGQFETIDTGLAAATDTVVTVTPTGDPTRFVQAGTGAMQARISYQNSLPFWVFSTENLYLPYRVRADHIFWSITP